jgi:2-succinyl-5-enolpyruvyl-6-hydroxy-3-cyclohexene-1-carboxylate synthase
VTDEKVFCVIGDLSFFYDQNALWNQNLRQNLRILLLNNGRGGIFNLLPGLEQSPARDPYVAASHRTTAEGICRQCNVEYLRAEDAAQLHEAIDALLHSDAPRPLLLEVLTDAAADEQAFRSYFKQIG